MIATLFSLIVTALLTRLLWRRFPNRITHGLLILLWLPFSIKVVGTALVTLWLLFLWSWGQPMPAWSR